MEEMTASEILRSNADDNWSTGVLGIALDLNIEEVYHDSRIFRILADKIEGELLQARNASLRHGAELWAKANGWPDFKQGEDFGAWLDRCALKLPCDKDGEPWSIGDRVMPGNRSESTVTGYSFDGADWFLEYRWCGIDSYANEFATSCKRPAPEVLGADGLSIKEGETVYDIETGEAYIVRLPCAGTGKTFFWGGGYRDPAYLTHTPPDTQERIDREKMVGSKEYWSCTDISCMRCPSKIDEELPSKHYGVRSCSIAQGMDIARRQRELDARKGGAE